MLSLTPRIDRSKTAIRRRDLSRPVKCAMTDGLLNSAATFLDYGCGRGEDVDLLAAQGFSCSGWDPVFRPTESVAQADIVNLGFVLNVIEDRMERAATLQRAWDLTRQLLVVSALVRIPGRGNAFVEFGDGVLTSRGTFQKFFDQAELRAYVESELKTEAIPATVGVFYVFRDEIVRQQFLANRVRRGPAAPRQKVSARRFEEHREVLQPFLETLAVLGRLPDPEEFPQFSEIISRLGSLKRAFALVRRVTGEDTWKAIRRRRMEDLLVFLALARFRKRPKLSGYPHTLQRDFRAFFGTYIKACEHADALLFRTGDVTAIDEACRRSPVGKLLPNALYVHRSALDCLEPILRIYEGCARNFLGEVEGANIIKLHRFSGKVSYLVYPDFDKDPHPALVRSVKLSLRTRGLECLEYGESENPPVLHRKETFLHSDHTSYAKFARLTKQEEQGGLLDETATIGTRLGWKARLTSSGFQLRGHRLVRCPRESGQQLLGETGADQVDSVPV